MILERFALYFFKSGFTCVCNQQAQKSWLKCEASVVVVSMESDLYYWMQLFKRLSFMLASEQINQFASILHQGAKQKSISFSLENIKFSVLMDFINSSLGDMFRLAIKQFLAFAGSMKDPIVFESFLDNLNYLLIIFKIWLLLCKANPP